MITFRPMDSDDRQFVISGWSSSFRKSPYAGMISNERYSDVMHREIAAILDRPTTRTLVACEPEELDHLGRQFLYGFIAVRSTGAPYVYYCYVRLGVGFRRRGIARKLLHAADIDEAGPFKYAYRTDVVRDLAARIPLATWDRVTALEET